MYIYSYILPFFFLSYSLSFFLSFCFRMYALVSVSVSVSILFGFPPLLFISLPRVFVVVIVVSSALIVPFV